MRMARACPCVMCDNVVKGVAVAHSPGKPGVLDARVTTSQSNVVTSGSTHACPLCEEEFEVEAACTKHLSEAHNTTRTYRCAEAGCAAIATTRAAFNKHAFSAHRRAVGQCNGLCSGRASQCKALCSSVSCPECDKVFCGARRMRCHYSKCHRRLQQVTCGVCGCEMARNRLYYHMSTHKENRLYYHMSTHKDYILLMSTHKENMPPPPPPPPGSGNVAPTRHTCESCSAPFSSVSLRNRHQRECAGLETFPCDACDARFTAKRNLDRHRSCKHHGGSTFPCDVCGKTYSSKRNLERHQWTIHSS